MPNKIYSRFDRPETISEPVCAFEEQRYIEKIDKNGASHLVEAEMYPFYDNIQKFKDDCDVYKILDRYENGDPDVAERLNVQGGSFGDFSDLPTDIIDIKNKLKSAETLFNNLPTNEKQECDNNVNVFLSRLTQGILPASLEKILNPEAYKEKYESPKIEEKVEQAVQTSTSTIAEAVNGQGGNL